ncbi:hypothetical protein Q7M_1234 (plasmid) [Borrelia crocidurae str. Achema]|uniref:Uncharacterized protein n=1 Tax=Borrelia crocidurae (strain Achema) TaxID=1155096 RepID=I0FET5_BORCA|nr:hypothetical protein Q7M_1234 [Borrelia crocidurae str. Achema]
MLLALNILKEENCLGVFEFIALNAAIDELLSASNSSIIVSSFTKIENRMKRVKVKLGGDYRRE